MGVTIHFEGQLKSVSDYSSVIEKAEAFASSNDMGYEKFDLPNKKLSRVKGEKDWEYEGSTRGIRIQPSENTDPLWLEFDETYYVQDYCKTQFADIGIHIKIIGLLKQLEEHFKFLNVIDEGEYWETKNTSHLQNMLNECFEAMEDAIKENDKLIGPVRMEGDRIIDLIEE